MEFVDGENLGQYVKRHGLPEMEVAVDWVIQAAEGLAYAHQNNVIHRNVKPTNLMLDTDGQIKVVGMGLARFDEPEDEDQDNITMQGVAIGTIDYMAPEQTLDSHSADQCSDIYSLGCTLYFLLTGQPPYAGKSPMEIFQQHRMAPIPVIGERRPEVPAALDQIFANMVAKLPSDRYQSMEDVIDALQSFDEEPDDVAASRFDTWSDSADEEQPDEVDEDEMADTTINFIRRTAAEREAEPVAASAAPAAYQRRRGNDLAIWISVGIAGLLILGALVILAVN